MTINELYNMIEGYKHNGYGNLNVYVNVFGKERPLEGIGFCNCLRCGHQYLLLDYKQYKEDKDVYSKAQSL